MKDGKFRIMTHESQQGEEKKKEARDFSSLRGENSLVVLLQMK